MELVKIDRPIKENMDYSLTEEQCDALFTSIKDSLNSEYTITKAIRESDIAAQAIGAGAAAVLITIAAITKWIKNKYRLTVNKLLDQSKELNDIYVKVNDLLKNDKMARFKHRNDRIDYEIHYIIMKDSRDPRKDYVLNIDYLAYDPEFFINEINDIMKYVNEYSKDKKADLQSMKAALLEKIDNGFKENHGFVEYCEPVMKIATYKGEKLEKVLTSYKTVIGNIYNNLYVYNKYIASELQYMQALQQAYNKMLSTYGKSKEEKAVVDEVFKKLLKNVTKSMDFNSKAMVILNDMIRFYTDELTKLYDLIRS